MWLSKPPAGRKCWAISGSGKTYTMEGYQYRAHADSPQDWVELCCCRKCSLSCSNFDKFRLKPDWNFAGVYCWDHTRALGCEACSGFITDIEWSKIYSAIQATKQHWSQWVFKAFLLFKFQSVSFRNPSEFNGWQVTSSSVVLWRRGFHAHSTSCLQRSNAWRHGNLRTMWPLQFNSVRSRWTSRRVSVSGSPSCKSIRTPFWTETHSKELFGIFSQEKIYDLLNPAPFLQGRYWSQSINKDLFLRFSLCVALCRFVICLCFKAGFSSLLAWKRFGTWRRTTAALGCCEGLLFRGESVWVTWLRFQLRSPSSCFPIPSRL